MNCQVDVFPPVFEQSLEKKKVNEISDANRKSQEKILRLQNDRPGYLDSRKIVDSWAWIGLIAGIIICIRNIKIGEATFGNIVVTGIVSVVAGFVMGYIFLLFKKISNAGREKAIDMEISNEKTRLEEEREQIKLRIPMELNEYVEQFESEAQVQSVSLADSELAIEVINWMTEGFKKTIDAADRRGHIEKINVPFDFSVFRNKITCTYGTYDFEIKRCSFLENPVQQTALARAIASAIQLNIVMAYPKDASGTDVSIDISYRYTKEAAVARVTYIAPNGNYKEAKSW